LFKKKGVTVVGIGGGSIFNLPLDEPDVGTFTAVLCGIILFTVILEHFMEHLHHNLDDKQMKMLEKMKDELMLLGVISFIVVLIVQSGIQLGSFLILFEFVHILVFFVAVALVFNTVSLVRYERFQSEQWEKMDSDTFSETEMRKVNNRIDQEPIWRSQVTKMGLVSTTRLHGEYLLCKTIFYLKNNLENHDWFNFPMYLTFSLEETILKILHVGPASWYVVIAVALFNFLRDQIFIWLGFDSQGSLMFIALGWLIFIVDLFVLASLRKELDLYLDQLMDCSGAKLKLGQVLHFQLSNVRVAKGKASYSKKRFKLLENILGTSTLGFAFYTASFFFFYVQRILQQNDGRMCVIILVLMVFPILFHLFYFNKRIISNYTMLASLHIENQRVYERVVEHVIDENMNIDRIRAVFMMSFHFNMTGKISNRRKMREVFRRYDKTGDLKLSLKEFSLFCKDMCGEKTSKERIEMFWKATNKKLPISDRLFSKRRVFPAEQDFVTFDEFKCFLLQSPTFVVPRGIDLSNPVNKICDASQEYKNKDAVHAFQLAGGAFTVFFPGRASLFEMKTIKKSDFNHKFQHVRDSLFRERRVTAKRMDRDFEIAVKKDDTPMMLQGKVGDYIVNDECILDEETFQMRYELVLN